MTQNSEHYQNHTHCDTKFLQWVSASAEVGVLLERLPDSHGSKPSDAAV